MKMKRISKFIALLAIPAFAFGAVACESADTNSGPLHYTDVVERPEIEVPSPAKTVVYPQKPAQKPSAPQPGTAPTIGAFASSAADSPYTVTEEEGKTTVAFNEVSDWTYVYIPVEDYSAEYGNMKLTIENSAEKPAERIAIQAVYYEGYELNYAPVTVFLGELGEGEQYVIVQLGEHMITDENYNPVSNSPVREKTVLGFVVFIDSLPSYAPLTDKTGSVDFLNVEMLKDDDPKLLDRYVKPAFDWDSVIRDASITSFSKADEKITASGTGGINLPVNKYTADYTKYTFSAKGSGSVSVGVVYRLDGHIKWTLREIELTSELQTFEYDFTEVFAEGNDDLKTQYIKNGTITAIDIEMEDGSIEMSDITFVRTATGGAYVSNVWTGSPSVDIVRAANGGNAKLEYSFHTDWTNISVPVRNGAGIKRMTFKIYAPDGMNHLGIGVSSTSSLSSNNQPVGNYILRPSRYVFDGNNSERVGSTPSKDEDEPNLKGMTETVAYDAATKIYTVTYDFTEMNNTENKSISDYTITSLIFYLNCPCAGSKKEAHTFEGKRSIYILSIGLMAE